MITWWGVLHSNAMDYKKRKSYIRCLAISLLYQTSPLYSKLFHSLNSPSLASTLSFSLSFPSLPSLPLYSFNQFNSYDLICLCKAKTLTFLKRTTINMLSFTTSFKIILALTLVVPNVLSAPAPVSHSYFPFAFRILLVGPLTISFLFPL